MPRVLVLGLDGLDPKLFARFSGEGLLPHLTALQHEGAWGQLIPTFPPVSPVVWTSFLTGLRPTAHGILDFMTKAPGEYHATIGLYQVTRGSDGLFHYHNRRSAPTLFHLLPPSDDACLWLPGTFPAESPPTHMLSGLGAPDLLATLGTSALYTTHPHHHPSSEPGYVYTLRPSAAGWGGEVQGPADTHLPFSLHRTQEGLTLQLSGCPTCLISPGEWTPWLEPRFSLAGRAAPGLCRFKLLRVGEELTVYRTPLWCHPADPLYPVAQPPGWGTALVAEVGSFSTAGFGGDQLALREGLIDRATYLEDAYAFWEAQAAIARRLVAERSWRLGAIHFMVADALQHLFWRDVDPLHPAHDPQESPRWRAEIERGYRWLDHLVGELVTLSGPDTLLVILSDHGMTPLTRRVDINGWLHRRGYVVLRRGKVDWASSRAFAFGHGGIWLNLVGRERNGCVPEADYEVLRRELVAALEGWRDPESNAPVMQGVWRWERHRPDQGGNLSPPDIGFALTLGYGLERRNLMGDIGREESLICPNRGVWSAGHEGPYRPADVPGLLFLHGPGIPPGATLQGARMVDLAPTLLQLLGMGPPSQLDGKSLLQ
jgi:predicted AlkP superfamily phosphohydrolase/phosphomutase